MVIVIAEDNDAIVAGHAAQRIGICRGGPDRSLGGCVIAIACTAAGVGVEVDIPIAVQDRALHRETGRNSGDCPCAARNSRYLHAACAKTTVVASIDAGRAVAVLNQRWGRRGCTGQLNMPLINRDTVGIRLIAPEVLALAGEVQVRAVRHDGGTDIARVACFHVVLRIGKRHDAACRTEVLFAAIVEVSAVAAEVDVVTVAGDRGVDLAVDLGNNGGEGQVAGIRAVNAGDLGDSALVGEHADRLDRAGAVQRDADGEGCVGQAGSRDAVVDVVVIVVAVDLTVVVIGRLLVDLISRAAAGLRGAQGQVDCRAAAQLDGRSALSGERAAGSDAGVTDIETRLAAVRRVRPLMVTVPAVLAVRATGLEIATSS